MIFGPIFSGMKSIATFIWRRQDQKHEAKLKVSEELASLACLMREVLDSTDSSGKIAVEKIGDLERLRKRNWSRWLTILESDAYPTLSRNEKEELSKAINIAHVAPGAFVKEIYDIQVCLAEGTVPKILRSDFASSIDDIENAIVKLKLSGR